MRFQNIIERISQLAARGLDFHLRPGSGVVAVVDSPDEWVVYDEVFQQGEYDGPITDALASFSKGPGCIVDLGANVGFFPLRVLDRWRVLHGDAPFHFD